MELFYLIIATSVVIVITIVVGLNMYKNRENSIDRRIQSKINKNKSESLTKVFSKITRLGNVESLIIIITPILFILIRDRSYTSASLVINALGFSIFSSQFFKLLFRRARPILEKRRVNTIGYSYPSGHATVGTSVYISLAYLLSSMSGGMPSIIATGFIVSILIAISRIYLSVHWTSDVIVGFLLGLSSSAWAIFLYKNSYVLKLLFLRK